jgi:hypothetical protein
MNEARELQTSLRTPTLRRGQVGWVVPGTLGVAFVIEGEFAGWNWWVGRHDGG